MVEFVVSHPPLKLVGFSQGNRASFLPVADLQVYDRVTRYAIGTTYEHFLAFWLSTERTPGQTSNPILHVVGDDRGITAGRLSPDPICTEISIDEYTEWRHGSS